MVKLLFSGYLRYLLKTKIVVIGPVEVKYHMNKVFPKLRNVGDSLSWCRNTDHRFGGNELHIRDSLVLRHKMMEQRDCFIRLALKEI